MTQTEAIDVARAYAAEYDVPWVGLTGVRRIRAWWYFHVLAYHFDIDTGGEGTARASVDTRLRGVIMFEFRPVDPGRFWLPPWAALPMRNSVSIAWKMGGGDRYWIDWHQWFAGLPDARKAAYELRFPEPDRDGWPGFYELARCRI